MFSCAKMGPLASESASCGCVCFLSLGFESPKKKIPSKTVSSWENDQISRFPSRGGSYVIFWEPWRMRKNQSFTVNKITWKKPGNHENHLNQLKPPFFWVPSSNMAGWKSTGWFPVYIDSNAGIFQPAMLVYHFKFVSYKFCITPLKFNSSPLKNGWFKKDDFLMGPANFSGANCQTSGPLDTFGSSSWCINHILDVVHPDEWFHLSRFQLSKLREVVFQFW